MEPTESKNTPKSEDQQPQEPTNPEEEIPQDAWDKMDDLLDKALGVDQDKEAPAQAG